MPKNLPDHCSWSCRKEIEEKESHSTIYTIRNRAWQSQLLCRNTCYLGPTVACSRCNLPQQGPELRQARARMQKKCSLPRNAGFVHDNQMSCFLHRFSSKEFQSHLCSKLTVSVYTKIFDCCDCCCSRSRVRIVSTTNTADLYESEMGVGEGR